MSSMEQDIPAYSSRDRRLLELLFPEEGDFSTFVVLDGASVEGLLDRLRGGSPLDYACLYRGELEPDIAEVAPYVVRLRADSPFTQWVVAEGWGKHWGVFIQTQESQTGLWKHLRKFLVVKDPNGKQLYFRYYDPRVLRLYLRSCNEEEAEFVFGPVHAFLCEDENAEVLLAFHSDGGLVWEENLRVVAERD